MTKHPAHMNQTSTTENNTELSLEYHQKKQLPTSTTEESALNLQPISTFLFDSPTITHSTVQNTLNKTRHLIAIALIFLAISNYVFGQSPVNRNGSAPFKEAIDVTGVGRVNPNEDGSAALLPPPSNDDCGSAVNLTVGASCVTGTTSTATQQVGEFLCINPGGGIAPETVWYRFTATSTEMVLGFVQTNATNCATVLAVYGPFAPGGGCLPGVGNQILCQNMGLIDPGFHPRLTGLTVGQTYLVQVQGNNCGGANDRFSNFCISVNTVSANSVPGGSSVINNCGVAFTGGTTGGHYASGTSTGSNNLDGNATTSIAGASEAGDDVTFVINNASWFTFCNGNAGACTWSVNLNGISGCLLSGLNAGVQAAVFTGTPAALTNVAVSPSRIAPGTSWASGSFSVGGGQCAYIMVDGFAGDECNYNLTLSNVSCPCVTLPVELAYLSGLNRKDHVQLDWQLAAGENLGKFTLERSTNGQNWAQIAEIQAYDAPSEAPHRYQDNDANPGWNYYRLSVADRNGQITRLGAVEVFRMEATGLEFLANVPSSDQINLFVQSPTSGNATVVMNDVQGKQIMQSKLSVQAGSNQFPIKLEGVGSGVYVLNLNMNGKTISRRVAIP